MAENGDRKSLAVLIDADNRSARYAHAIFEEIVKLGEANVRRIYGDFTGSRLSGWGGAIQSLAILQHQQRSNTTGKNAADIALVIDAMDLMHKGRLDGFCLVSSDSDFTRLAQRLREDGLVVYGLGVDGPDVAVEHRLEALDDVARVGETEADEVGEESGCVGRKRLGWLHGAVSFVPMRENGGGTPSPGHPAAAPLTARLLLLEVYAQP